MLEATYGWYWAVNALQDPCASVHLAHSALIELSDYAPATAST